MTISTWVCLLCVWMALFGFVAAAVSPGMHRNLFTALFCVCAVLVLGLSALDYFDIIGQQPQIQLQAQHSQPDSQLQPAKSGYTAAGPMIWFAVMSILSLLWGVFINRPYPEEETLESLQIRRIKNNLALLAIGVIGMILLYNLI